MKLVILAVGRMKAGPERELLRRYVDRAEALGRTLGLSGPQIVELDESRARSADARRREEAALLGAKLPAGADLILLDERGKQPTSADFAERLAKARDGGVSCIAFAIGGADGLDPALRQNREVIAFGRATFPHQIVRVLLVEQIYRGLTLMAGHPYHRA